MTTFLFQHLFHCQIQPFDTRVVGPSTCVLFQVCLGVAWTLGSIGCGLLVLRQRTRDFRMAKIYLWQNVLMAGGILLCCLPMISGPSALLVFAWLYGLFLGAYQFMYKSFLFERVRSKDFSQALSLLHLGQGISMACGLPIMHHVNESHQEAVGFLISGVIMLTCAAAVYLCNNCGRNISNERSRFKSKKTQTNAEECTCDKETKEKLHNIGEGFVLGNELNNINQAMISSFLWRHFNGNQDGLAAGFNGDFDDDFDDEDEFDDEFDDDNIMIVAEENIEDFLYGDDNITSCNKVEHQLIFSEFEQNMSKETEKKRVVAGGGGLNSSNAHHGGGGGHGARTVNRLGRLWTLRRQSTEDLSLSDRSVSSSNENRKDATGKASVSSKTSSVTTTTPTSSSSSPQRLSGADAHAKDQLPKFRKTLNKGIGGGLTIPKERSITTIEEVSSNEPTCNT